MDRRRPGQYAEGEGYNIYFREAAARPARAADAVRAVFSKGGACYDCHTIIPPAAGDGWRVTPVHQTPRFLDKGRSEEHTSELQSLMRISYAVFCLKNKNADTQYPVTQHTSHKQKTR